MEARQRRQGCAVSVRVKASKEGQRVGRAKGQDSGGAVQEKRCSKRKGCSGKVQQEEKVQKEERRSGQTYLVCFLSSRCLASCPGKVRKKDGESHPIGLTSFYKKCDGDGWSSAFNFFRPPWDLSPVEKRTLTRPL